MESSANKETLKLLKISDDSKSDFSDLDLPEITTQRKRKVRRKTRPRLTSTSHSQPDVITTSAKDCNALIIYIVVFFASCWLLTLSYMIAVIHSENLRLEVQIKKLAVTSQNLPETLQQWHETSKQLEQNQTIIYKKIADLQAIVENLSANVTLYKSKVDETNNYSKEQKIVADFGAKVEAVTGDVERMKERFADFKKDQTTTKDTVNVLQENFSKLMKSSSLEGGSTANANNSEAIKSLETTMEQKFTAMNSMVSSINDTLSQKSKILKDELTTQQQKLGNLIEESANITSHVTSVEDDWTKYKQKVVDFDAAQKLFSLDISELKNASKFLGSSLDDVRSTCNKYHTEAVQNVEELRGLYLKNGQSKQLETPRTESSTPADEGRQQFPELKEVPNKIPEVNAKQETNNNTGILNMR